jgi:hypothetical protein
VIKFVAGNCLNGIEIVLKESLSDLPKDKTLSKIKTFNKGFEPVLSLRALIHEFFQKKFNHTRNVNIVKNPK